MQLLLVIYLIFIGVGLPDSLLGTAWPFMAEEFREGVDRAGVLSMTISIGIIIAGLTACRLSKKLGSARTAAVGLLLFITALIGYGFSRSFVGALLFSIPLGLGSGFLQTIMNEFVASNYSSRHMNWLHGSWGIGAAVGPLIISAAVSNAVGWRGGYFGVALIEAVLLILLLRVRPVWEKQDGGKAFKNVEQKEESKGRRKGRAFTVDKVFMAGQFFLYCSVENAMMLWGASYLIFAKGFEASMAAQGVSLFFVGITAGRFFGGILVEKLGNTCMIFGCGGMALLADLFLMNTGHTGAVLAIFVLLGFVMAPIYPIILHQTPGFFPKEDLSMLMGLQVASAYVGITVMPPIFGKLFAEISFDLLPFIQLAFLAGVLLCVWRLTRRSRRRNKFNGGFDV